MHKHVLEVSQFNRETLDHLLDHAEWLRTLPRSAQRSQRPDHILVTVFYEPSTRTRLSFESAMVRLGGRVISAENAGETSSAVKGETIEDTARMLAGYADMLVMRHPEAGAPAKAAQAIDIPLINAGDGAREHPTQALLDLYTIRRERGTVDGLHIAIMGDLKYGRAPRSLAQILASTRGTHITFIAPSGVEMADDVKATLDQAGVTWDEERDLMKMLPHIDVLYQTRIQKERFPSESEYEAARGHYIVDHKAMEHLNKSAIVLHPLPRVDEITPDVDADPRAAYFRQAENGVYLRMALIDTLFRKWPIA